MSSHVKVVLPIQASQAGASGPPLVADNSDNLRNTSEQGSNQHTVALHWVIGSIQAIELRE